MSGYNPKLFDIQRSMKMSTTCKEKIINRYQPQDDTCCNYQTNHKAVMICSKEIGLHILEMK